jgi:DNA-directed RNA polymerase specialized sigma24 family protein
MMLPMTIQDERAKRAFSEKLRGSIRKVLRSRGVPERELEDKFQQVRLEVQKSSANVPTSEPQRTHYIHAVARNVGRMYRIRLAAQGGEPLPLDDAEPALAVEVAPYESIDLARRVHADALATDAQATDWFLRAKVYGEREKSIADEDGVPVDRVRQRIKRLVTKMRANSDSLAMFASLLFFATLMAEWSLHQGAVATTPDQALSAATTEQPAPTAQSSAELRRAALSACDAHQWARCIDTLEVAKSLDPAGDAAQDVQFARQAAADAMRAAPTHPVPNAGGKPTPHDIK